MERMQNNHNNTTRKVLSIEDLLKKDVEIDGVRVLWTKEECPDDRVEEIIVNAGEYPGDGEGYVHFIGTDLKSRKGNFLFMTLEMPVIGLITSISRPSGTSICVRITDCEDRKRYRLMMHSTGRAVVMRGFRRIASYKKV